MANLIQSSLNAGELSPLLDARVDIDKYRSGLGRLENFIPYPQGGVCSRPGFKYVAEVKNSDYRTYMVPFIYNTEQAYILEFSPGYIRVIMDGGVIANPDDPSEPYEIRTPYTAEDLENLQWAQTADVLYLVTPGKPQRKLTRLGHASWTLTQVAWNDGPWLTENSDGVTYLSCSDVTGNGVTVKAEKLYAKEYTGSYGNDPTTPQEFCSVERPCPVLIFTASKKEKLRSVLIWVTTQADVELTVYLYASDGSKATGSILASTASFHVNLIGSREFPFSNPYLLTEGEKYAIVFGTSATSELQCQTVENITDYKTGYAATPTGTVTTLVEDTDPVDWKFQLVVQPVEDANVFTSENVGSLYRIRHSGQEIRKTFEALDDVTDTPIKIRGKFTVDLTPKIGQESTWAGRIVLEKSWNEVTWFEVASFYYSTKQEFWETEKNVYYRLRCASRDEGKARGSIAQEERWGTIQITAVANAYTATANVLHDLGSTEPSPMWREGAWSPRRGYPSAVMFDGDRLVFGGTNFQPYTIWASWTSDYENHSPSDTDDAPYVFTLSKLSNRIVWLESDDAPLVGTIGEEARLIVAKQAPLSQNNPPEVSVQSRRGSASNVRPLSMGPGVLILDRARRKVLELSYDLQTDKVTPVELTRLAEHVTVGGLRRLVYQQNPHSVVWAPREDGTLTALTYYRAENVLGWARHITRGAIEDVCCIPSALGDEAGYDQLWVIVRRNVGGEHKRFIEVLDNHESLHAELYRAWVALDDARRHSEDFANGAKALIRRIQKEFYCLDCGLTYDGAATATITGLDHLEGATVSIVADGIVLEPQEVVDGSVTLEDPASVVHVGLPYTALLKTMRLEASIQTGTVQGKTKKLSQVTLRVLHSTGGKYFATAANVLDIPVLEPDEQLMDEPPLLVTGDIDITWSGDWEREGVVTILQDQPLPMSVLGIVQEVVVGG